MEQLSVITWIRQWKIAKNCEAFQGHPVEEAESNRDLKGQMQREAGILHRDAGKMFAEQASTYCHHERLIWIQYESCILHCCKPIRLQKSPYRSLSRFQQHKMESGLGGQQQTNVTNHILGIQQFCVCLQIKCPDREIPSPIPFMFLIGGNEFTLTET